MRLAPFSPARTRAAGIPRSPFLAALFFCLFCALPLPALAMGEREHGYGTGYRSISFVPASAGSDLKAPPQDAVEQHMSVWYPVQGGNREGLVKSGGWNIRAQAGARPARGRFPVILLSHGMASSGLYHHGLASALAQNGFVVVAVTHTGDNTGRADALFSTALLFHRPRQLAGALAWLVTDPLLGPALDTGRIGLLGVGSGAVTVLQMTGVDLNADAYSGYCARPDAETPFCTPFAASRLSLLTEEAKTLRRQYGPGALAPELPQVKAVGLLTPGGLFMLQKDGLARLTVPLAVFYAERDELFPAALEREDLLATFPPPLGDGMLAASAPDADHYSLASMPPEALAEDLPGSAGALRGRARERAAELRDRFFISFFSTRLGPPSTADLAAP